MTGPCSGLVRVLERFPNDDADDGHMGTFDSLRGDPHAAKREEIAEALHTEPPEPEAPAADEISGCLREAANGVPTPPSEACPPQKS